MAEDLRRHRRRVRSRRLAEIREAVWTAILIVVLVSIVAITAAAIRYMEAAGNRDVQIEIERTP